MNNILNLKKYSNSQSNQNWAQPEQNNRELKAVKITSFTRDELNHILTVYGRKVVTGEWRDYAVDTLKDRAIFSVYRKCNELPQYTIHKLPKLKSRGKMYQITGSDGRVLKRGSELPLMLKILDKNKSKYRII